MSVRYVLRVVIKAICVPRGKIVPAERFVSPFCWLCILLAFTRLYAMRIYPPFPPTSWCAVVESPNWPFAYAKCSSCSIEAKGRVNSNLQDMRHSCQTFGTRSKCHRCESNVCANGNPCPFQIQGIDPSQLPANVPAISDTPWAIGGSHRNAFQEATSVCAIMSGGECLEPYNHAYQHCKTRCWGANSGALRHIQISNSTTPYFLKALFENWEYDDTSQNYQGASSTLAGTGQPGYVDGLANRAQFLGPQDVAVDETRNVYVADTGNHVIRKISIVGGSYYVSTLSGTGSAGWRDGSALEAQFSSPSGIAVYHSPGTPPRAVTVYVADTGNHRVRKVDISTNTVTCHAGRCGYSTDSETLSGNYASPQPGYADGPGSTARFSSPTGIAVDENGIVFIADTGNHLIRMISQDGTVSTLAGTVEASRDTMSCPPPCFVGVRGYRDGPLNYAKFSYPRGITVGQGRTLLVTDSHRVRRVTYADVVSDLQGIRSQNRVSTVSGHTTSGERDGFGSEARYLSPVGIEMSRDGRVYIADSDSCRLHHILPVGLAAQQLQCSTTATEIIRPSGCSSYNPPEDSTHMTGTPMSGNIYFNYLARNVSDIIRGEDVVGRTIKPCVGSPPPAFLQTGSLVVEMLDDGLPITSIDEDDGFGTMIIVKCPIGCGVDTSPVWGSDIYSDNSSVCKAAIHAGAVNTDGVVALILEKGLQDTSSSEAAGSLRNGVQSVSIFDSTEASRRFRLQAVRISEVVSQTIAGGTAAKLEQGCGYKDGKPPQRAMFSLPSGLSLFVDTELSDREYLYVADTSNHVIRILSAVCTQPCENGGSCTAPNYCTCQPGWTGFDCTTPVCSIPCGNRQLCVGPSKCDCIPGYGGMPQCEQALCAQSCLNGGVCSAPDTCTCQLGWFDPKCSTPVCSQTCGNGGKCVGPDTCWCPSEWSGSDCRVPVCSQSCENGGYCVAPNTCLCPPQWSGHDCSIPVCTQGYFVPDPSPFLYGSNRPRLWNQYTPCGYRAWCNRTNSFDCLQPERKSNQLYMQANRLTNGLLVDPGLECFGLELRPSAITHFSYVNTDGSMSPKARYSQKSPYGPGGDGPWKPILTAEVNHTGPYTAASDRQVAWAERRRITQGVYVCANGGNCSAPDVCQCPKGWIGFDCRTPVCEQGYYEPDQALFVDGIHPNQPSSNPSYIQTVELVESETVTRQTQTVQGRRYFGPASVPQGGYSCSIRSITEWEKPRTIGPYGSPAIMFEHPNYYSRYMERAVQLDNLYYSHWQGMNWTETYRKSAPLFDDTNEGWNRFGIWYRIRANQWQKGVCLTEFIRVCGQQALGIVRDTDIAFRPIISYNDSIMSATKLRYSNQPNCIDQVIRGCYNNGTCIGPNRCQCSGGWTGSDCSVPLCRQTCANGGNCTLPDICTCEKGWTGPDCSVPLCAQDCKNGGQCLAPDTCRCVSWPSVYRNNRAGGGTPLFQKPDGSPQDTGYTGFDCNTPICTQASSFLLNVPRTSVLSVSLGGHGKNGSDSCNEERCPDFDKEIVRNDALSFQSGCGHLGNPVPYPESFLTAQEKISNMAQFRDVSNVNRTSQRYLCGVYGWMQGDYRQGRLMRTNYHHYQRLLNASWIETQAASGEGIFMCHNHGTCIRPDECTCTDGWGGFDCRTPKCRHRQTNGNVVGCLNGICGDKDNCTCIQSMSALHNVFKSAPSGRTGWTGTDCSIAMCVQGYFDPECPSESGEGCYRCPNDGKCVAPDLCACAEGWTGYDCMTPVCEVVADEVIRAQLHTVDEAKVLGFELDPCGTGGGRWGLDPFEGISQGQGNCTLPNLCTCLCKVFYDEEDCRLNKQNCLPPWTDPLGLALPPGFTFGTRNCYDGFEGRVDSNGRFVSCHLKIYVPSFWDRYKITIVVATTLGLVFGGAIYYIVRVKIKERQLRLKRAKRRQSREKLLELELDTKIQDKNPFRNR